jgi:hypothetical protein
MSDPREEPRERNNPSQATPQPHPDFIIRHDKAVQPDTHEEAQNKEQQEQPKSDNR